MHPNNGDFQIDRHPIPPSRIASRWARCSVYPWLGVALLFFASRGAATARTVVVDYAFPPPNVQIVGNAQSSVSVEGCEILHRIGQPEIPFLTGRILLPSEGQIAAIEVQSLLPEETIAVSLPLTFGRAPVPWAARDVEPASDSTPNPTTYGSDLPYPVRRITCSSIQSINGYRIAIVQIFPVQYRPASGRLLYCPKLRVSVTLSGVNATTALLRPSSAAQAARVANFVDNPSDCITVATRTPSGAKPLTESYDYLLVTASSLTNAFQPLINQKIADGLTVKVATMDTILAAYSGVDNAAKLRSFITYAYTNWNVTYVLLGGDVSTVPHRGAYAYCGSGYTDNNLPADLYFACLDGSWNSDGDAIWGEPTDGEGGTDVDLLSEVFVGRAPVDTPAEVTNFVSKVVSYEQNGHPRPGEVRLLGEYLGTYNGTYAQGGDGIDPILPSCDTYAINWLDDRPMNSAVWTKAQALAALNQSPHLVEHFGHANAGYALRMYNADVASLTNTSPFLLTSVGCNCGAFDSSDCLAEEFIKRNTSGAFAVLMNTRYGWFDETDEGLFSSEFMKCFFDELLVQGNRRLGEANQFSREDMIGSVETTGEMVYRWCYFEITLFGDPHTRIQAGVLPFTWLQNYGLPTDGSADRDDPDSDGLGCWAEWMAGTVPTNRLSVLQVQEAAPREAEGGIGIRWQSVTNKFYRVESAESPSGPFAPFATNIVGQTEATEILDDRPASRSRFYRIGIDKH